MREEKPSNLAPIIVIGSGIGVFGAIILATNGISVFGDRRTSSDPRVVSAQSFEKQYAIQKDAKASAADLCARAKLVAEAYLQAEVQEKYREWTEQSRTDCAIADLEATR